MLGSIVLNILSKQRMYYYFIASGIAVSRLLHLIQFRYPCTSHVNNLFLNCHSCAEPAEAWNTQPFQNLAQMCVTHLPSFVFRQTWIFHMLIC